MKINKAIQLLVFSILLNYIQGQNINSELSKLFFNADVTHLNPLLLDQFSRDTTLHKTVAGSDIVFTH